MKFLGKRRKSGNHSPRWILAILVMATSALPFQAEARLSTGNYTCSDVKDLIFQQGAIVLNTQSSSVYKRFVADRSFCSTDETVKRISVPSKSKKCRLNYCAQRNDKNN
jgi:hypothetical protein